MQAFGRKYYPERSSGVEIFFQTRVGLGLERTEYGEDGRTRAAFSALSGALSEGDGVVAAFAESYQTLAGETP